MTPGKRKRSMKKRPSGGCLKAAQFDSMERKLPAIRFGVESTVGMEVVRPALETAANFHAYPRSAPEARNPSSAVIVSGDPDKSISGARGNISNRSAHHDSNALCLGLSRAQSQSSSHQRCTKNHLLQHALHNFSLPAGFKIRVPLRHVTPGSSRLEAWIFQLHRAAGYA